LAEPIAELMFRNGAMDLDGRADESCAVLNSRSLDQFGNRQIQANTTRRQLKAGILAGFYIQDHCLCPARVEMRPSDHACGIGCGQVEENRLRRVKEPKSPQNQINVFSEEECIRMARAAQEFDKRVILRWELLIAMPLCTGMRRGELLDLIWRDTDFEQRSVTINPKDNSERTWEWHIKDTDRRGVPLTDEVVQLLADHQAAQPEGYPYVFVPPRRYDHIQDVRHQGKWTIRQGNCPVGNFRRQFKLILARAGIDEGTFHDLRRTCLTNWLFQGLSEYEVMIMAGHASFDTARKFYLAVRKDLLDRARKASSEAMKEISIANSLQVCLVRAKRKKAANHK